MNIRERNRTSEILKDWKSFINEEKQNITQIFQSKKRKN
tara:strand:+ start:1242 stop:1358 length:117 start_codon:yes stop_codon:yes gene_type:complete